MNLIVVEKYDSTYFQIICSFEQAMELHSFFQCYAKDFYFNPKFKAKLWNGKISFFDIHGGNLLPIGLLYKLKEFLVQFKYKVVFNFDIKEMYNDISEKEMKEFYSAIFKNSNYYPRDYQHKCIHAALKRKRGVIESATGSGKSLVIYSLIRFMMGVTDKKILLVVPNVSLTTQMFNDFIDYGWESAPHEASVLYSNSKRYNSESKILISTWQSIYKKKKKFFEQFDAVMVDECLHGDTFIQIDKDKFKKIKDIEMGDCVLSYNTKTGNIEKDEVLKLHKNLINSNNENMYEVEFENGSVIKITGNHKVLTKNRGYIRIDELTINDDILEIYKYIQDEDFNYKYLEVLYENQKN